MSVARWTKICVNDTEVPKALARWCMCLSVCVCVDDLHVPKGAARLHIAFSNQVPSVVPLCCIMKHEALAVPLFGLNAYGLPARWGLLGILKFSAHIVGVLRARVVCVTRIHSKNGRALYS